MSYDENRLYDSLTFTRNYGTCLIQAQIQALIIDSGDTAISEQALTDMVAANPSAAKDIADFATRPANLPSDLSADAVENLVIAVARAAASGAPEMAGDVVNALVD